MHVHNENEVECISVLDWVCLAQFMLLILMFHIGTVVKQLAEERADLVSECVSNENLSDMQSNEGVVLKWIEGWTIDLNPWGQHL